MPLIYDQHFSCYVINMEKKCIQYLDNRPTPDAEVQDFFESLVCGFLFFLFMSRFFFTVCVY